MIRVFASERREAQVRQPVDIAYIAVALVVLAGISFVAQPSAGIEIAVREFIEHLPTALHSVWRLAMSSAFIAASSYVVLALIAKRWRFIRDVFTAVIASMMLNVLVTFIVHDQFLTFRHGTHWFNSVDLGTETLATTIWYPPVIVTVSIAVLLGAAPHLVAPLRRVNRWVIASSLVGVALLGGSLPSAVFSSFILSVIAAAVVRLVFGTAQGQPSLDAARDDLANLGVEVHDLAIAGRQLTGCFVLVGTLADGSPARIKVYGRDAQDTQFVSMLWQRIWFRNSTEIFGGSQVRFNRTWQVEHEALISMLASRHDVLVEDVRALGVGQHDDALLVLTSTDATSNFDLSNTTDATCRDIWSMLQRLHESGIAHGSIDEDHLIIQDDHVGIRDFQRSSINASPQAKHVDIAQTIILTALAIGKLPAVRMAIEFHDDDTLQAVLPLIQNTLMSKSQRQRLVQVGLTLDAVREELADALEIEPPQVQKIKRVTAGTVGQTLIFIFAFLSLSSVMADIDFNDLWAMVVEAETWLLITALLIAQLPRIGQALATLGASPARLAFGPVYMLQLALGYIGLAIPSAGARIAFNVRFFQRQGFPAGSALAVGAVDGFSGFLVQVVLAVSILFFTPIEVNFSDTVSPGSGIANVLMIFIAIALLIGVLLVMMSSIRRRLIGLIRELISQAKEAIDGLQSFRRLSLLFGGNLMSDVLLAASLSLFLAAMGIYLSLGTIILILVLVSLLAGILPIPGGIGVVEGGIAFGLMQAGVEEEVAFAAALMYRFATFYLPPLWGFGALKWMERNKYL